MLSYRHGFHAGNHADVFKHLVLTLLVCSLLRKEKPFFYLDTHAGAGRYDLGSAMARKNREYKTGIGLLWEVEDAPEAVQDYLETVRLLNPDGKLRFYPGSPRVVRHYLRSADRMLLCELHPNEVKVLSEEFAGDKQVKIHHLDGYQALKALLPPPERRGLVLIDPAFELRDERRRLLDALKEGYRRWATGIFAVWYPIQDRATADDFLRRLQRTGIRKILLAEFSVFDSDETPRLNGSGMVIINPPWKLEENLRTLLPWLWKKLAVDGQGKWRVEWLVGE
ncbi:23S rRNA (adenine(2030)-N(6))-methyltransferase RlmJ [Methylocaldum szegediense]|uniref:Ribosomal RNA large subunit methyltransferase J n=1 Tax=Methylocaldum szegediense TaxID=73780 RepID=A0ABN8X5A8_9GAMM|nr:23S rRNA (adenine(2030)-N(6))-methyltransferase RlmJ [Methylocaldum szegediense]CAI8886327.1 Ribosomal RNA large subunit methyltransferase J [Methylocaldum szegediense]